MALKFVISRLQMSRVYLWKIRIINRYAYFILTSLNFPKVKVAGVSEYEKHFERNSSPNNTSVFQILENGRFRRKPDESRRRRKLVSPKGHVWRKWSAPIFRHAQKLNQTSKLVC